MAEVFLKCLALLVPKYLPIVVRLFKFRKCDFCSRVSGLSFH